MSPRGNLLKYCLVIFGCQAITLSSAFRAKQESYFLSKAVIFSSSILGMPVAVAGLFAYRWPAITSIITDYFGRESALYNVLNAGLIVFFTYFYTAIIFNPVELAENIRKSGGFIPGIRPGKNTSEFFDYLFGNGIYLFC